MSLWAFIPLQYTQRSGMYSQYRITSQSELLGQFRLIGDRAKYSMYSILYIDGDVTMC